MLLVLCPWCGRRSQSEFVYGGDATVVRPDNPEGNADKAWMDYAFLRDNPSGPHLEYWHHRHGCRRWFKAVRDTLSNEFLASGGRDLSLPGKGR